MDQLPAITGSSPKQIAYGEDMRARKYPGFAQAVVKLREMSKAPNTPAVYVEIFERVVAEMADELRNQTSARFWIDFPGGHEVTWRTEIGERCRNALKAAQ